MKLVNCNYEMLKLIKISHYSYKTQTISTKIHVYQNKQPQQQQSQQQQNR